MRTCFCFIVLGAGLAVASQEPLAGQIPSRMAFVDSQRAFEMSAQGRKAISQLRDRETRIKTDIGRLESELQILQTKYATQRFTLAYEALAQLESDINRKMTDRKRFEEDAIRDYENLRNSLFAKIRNDLVPIVQNLAKEKDLDAVFDLTAGGVLYVGPAADLTEEVIRRFNLAKMPVK